jgi:hypothetical protein
MSSVMIVSGDVAAEMRGDVKIGCTQKVLRIIGRPACTLAVADVLEAQVHAGGWLKFPRVL